MKKKVITLILVLALCFSMCPVSHAASGDLSIQALISNMTYPFTNDVVNIYDNSNPDPQIVDTAYFSYRQFPNGTNLSSVMTIFTYTGKALKINGTTVASYGTVSTRTYSHSEDLLSIATVEVVYGNNQSRVYYVSAYTEQYYVKMSFEYDNAVVFSTLSGSTYGTSGLLDTVTDQQKATAATAVASMDLMCESMLPDVTADEYKVLDNILVEPNSAIPNSNTVYGLMAKFAQARTNFQFTTNSGNNTFLSIGSLDKDSTGQHTDYSFPTPVVNGTGGWVYQVKRAGITYTPMIGATGWKLMPGDEVIWRYTCDYGYDVGAPMM